MVKKHHLETRVVLHSFVSILLLLVLHLVVCYEQSCGLFEELVNFRLAFTSVTVLAKLHVEGEALAITRTLVAVHRQLRRVVKAPHRLIEEIERGKEVVVSLVFALLESTPVLSIARVSSQFAGLDYSLPLAPGAHNKFQVNNALCVGNRGAPIRINLYDACHQVGIGDFLGQGSCLVKVRTV